MHYLCFPSKEYFYPPRKQPSAHYITDYRKVSLCDVIEGGSISWVSDRRQVQPPKSPCFFFHLTQASVAAVGCKQGANCLLSLSMEF